MTEQFSTDFLISSMVLSKTCACRLGHFASVQANQRMPVNYGLPVVGLDASNKRLMGLPSDKPRALF